MNQTSLPDSISAADGRDTGIQPALARSMLGHNMVAEVGHLSLIFFMVILLWNDVERLPLGGWAAAVTGATFFRLFLRRRFSTRGYRPRDLFRLVRLVVVLTAIAWSIGPVVFGAGLPAAHFALLMVVFAGLVAAATSTLVADRLTFRLFSTILLLPLAAVLLQSGQTRFHFIALCVIAFFGATMWLQHARAHEQLVRRLSSEAALEKKELYYRTLMHALHEDIMVIDRDYRISDINNSALRATGYKRQDVIGRTCYEVSHGYTGPCDKSGEICVLQELFRSGKPQQHRHIHETSDGRNIHVDILLSPLRDENGNVTKAIEAGRDISDLMNAQYALLESEEKLRAITSSAQDAILMMDDAGAVTFWNEAAERVLGYRAEEVLGADLHELIAPERFCAAHDAAFPDFVETGNGPAVGQTLELAAVRKDGEEIPVELSLSSALLDGRWNAIGIIRDISERKRVETELASLAAVPEQNPNPVVEVDYHGKLRYMNGAAKQSFPTLSRELSDSPLTSDVREVATTLAESGEEWLAREVDVKGRVFEEKICVVPTRDRIRIFAHDVTERNRAMEALRRSLSEVEKAQRELQAQAVELTAARDVAETAAQAKSAFLATMSHEIRTPIHGVLGTLDLMLDDELNDEQRRLAQQAYDSGETLLRVVNDVLDFTKIESGRLELEEITFDPVGLSEAVVRMLVVKAVEQGLELVCDVRPGVPRAVRGDPSRIRQVLTNLVGNAVKFTTDGEVVVLVDWIGRTDGTVDLVFSVRDTGIGIPPEKLETIFEEFNQVDVSTSRRYGGSGLGLAISTRLLNLMGSQMHVTSEVGRGSEFRFVVTFPIEANCLREPVGDMDSLRGIRVLVVDDNAVNRRVVKEMLTAIGMEIVDAPDGNTALGLLRSALSEGKPYDLGIIDGHMPGVDGYQLVERIRRDTTLVVTKLLMLTSGGQAGDGKRCRDLNVSAYLTKPVTRSELIEALVQVLAPSVPAPSGQLVTRHSIEEGRSRVRVLLAEDNSVNQLIAASLLRKRGHEVRVVENGRQAVHAVAEHEYDVVLMDVQMPELDGWAATREIRQMQKFEHLPIVALTAHAGESERNTCRLAGMNGYLRKPFKPHELFSVVEGWGGSGTDGGNGSQRREGGQNREPVDLGVLRETLGDAGDDEAFRVVLDVFLDDAPERIEAVEKAVASGDTEAVKRAAHAFKSSAATIGALDLAAMLEGIENNGVAENMDAAAEKARALRDETDAVVEFLKTNR